MKRRLAILLTLAMLLGMVGFAEDFEINEEIVIEAEDAEIPPDEVELEIGEIGLSIDDMELSAENEMDEVLELTENVNLSNASDDFDIQDGVLVKYKGPGGDVVIPDGVTSIGDNAFWGCNSLTGVTIPSGVTNIGDFAFYECTNLIIVSMSKGVTLIGRQAFAHCESLSEISIPDSVNFINNDAFGFCKKLKTFNVSAGNRTYTSSEGILYSHDMQTLICCPGGKKEISIPGSVKTIDYWAFWGCTINNIVIPENVTWLEGYCFCDCKKLKSIIVPASITRSGWHVFEGCINLKEATFLCNSFNTSYVFEGCTSLESVNIPEGSETLYSGAFSGCSSLKSITVPSNVKRICGGVFEDCINLTRINICGIDTTLDEGAIRNCPNLTIYGEAGSYAETYAKEHNIPFVVGSGSPSLTSKSPVIGVGENFSLIASNSPVSAAQCKFTSKDKTTVTVNKKGVITGVKKGSTTVTVTPTGSKAIKVKVTVKKAPNYVSLTPEEVTIGIGETITPFRAHLTRGSASALTWSSSKRKYATVDGEGTLKGIKKGTTTITVRTFNDMKDTSEVTVKAAPKSISFPKTSVTLGLGEELPIKASLNKDSGGSITYEILNADIAVYRDGKLKGTYTGETMLRATTYNGLFADMPVTVVNSPTKITVPEELFMGIKEKVPLDASIPEGTHTTLKYKSSKTSVATVNSSGMITAKNVGTTEITVTAHNGVKAVCAVTVKKRATDFTLKPAKVELKLGETKRLKVTFKKDTAASIVWTTSDRNVATVGDGGLVTAVGAGEATITAKLLSGSKKKTCKVMVKEGIPEKLERLKERFPDGKYWDHRVETAGYDAFKRGG